MGSLSTEVRTEVLCGYICALEEERDQLRVANAKLRELMYERAHVYAIQNMTEDELRITATNVMEDNAKLRELFSSYWKRTHSPVGPNVERDYLSEMRQLGIEVD